MSRLVAKKFPQSQRRCTARYAGQQDATTDELAQNEVTEGKDDHPGDTGCCDDHPRTARKVTRFFGRGHGFLIVPGFRETGLSAFGLEQTRGQSRTLKSSVRLVFQTTFPQRTSGGT